MALKSISLENFRGKPQVVYAFAPGLNKVQGRNGSGKSTIKEAICFGFCGTDSLGTRNPKHLISEGQAATKVTITTDKAEIVRTLTDKGNGTIRLTREGGVSQTLTQTQLETMLGSTDLFLSSLLPGFFLTLPTERQHKVISEVQPKVDRLSLFQELAGFELAPEEQLRYALSRRTDLVASQVAGDRRDLEKQAAVKQGEVKQLETLAPLPHPGPEPTGLQHLDDLKGRWDQFKRLHTHFRTLSETVARVASENEKRRALKKDLQAKLDALVVPASPVLQEIDLDLIRKDLLRDPAEPSVTNVVESDTCPTCAQTVGLKHRERVKGLNAEVLAKYEQELARVAAHNQSVQERVDSAKKENQAKKEAYLAQLEDVRKAQAQKQRLTFELEQCIEVETPAAPPEPQAPEEAFDELEYSKAKKQRDDHRAMLAQHEYVQAQVDQAQGKLEKLRNDIGLLEKTAARLQKIEDALKLLPAEELKRQASSFDLGEIKLQVGSEVTAYHGDLPYGLLSTGTQMKAGVAVSRKLDSMMARPLGILFLDNADLVDKIDLENVQAFLAEVTDHEQVSLQ